MQIVRQLDDKEKFMQETHGVIWKINPKFGNIFDILLAQDHISSPEHAHEVKHN